MNMLDHKRSCPIGSKQEQVTNHQQKTPSYVSVPSEESDTEMKFAKKITLTAQSEQKQGDSEIVLDEVSSQPDMERQDTFEQNREYMFRNGPDITVRRTTTLEKSEQLKKEREE